MASVPTVPAAETVVQRVICLRANWREQTPYLSLSTQITGHLAYQELTALRRETLPFLFRDLEQTGDGHLSKALTTLTGAHPVPAEDRGKIRRVAEAWLQWARENGFRW